MRTIRHFAGMVLMIACHAVWAVDSCDAIPETDFEPGNSARAEKVRIRADQIDFPGRNTVLLRGYTQLIRGGHRVYADELVYDKTRNKAEARGVVKLETPNGDVVETSILTYDVTNGIAVSGPARFSIANRPSQFLGSEDSSVNAFGFAERVTFESDDIMLLDTAQVTSCLDGKEDITFQAAELRIDLNEGVRTGTRVRIQIADPGRHKRLRELEKSLN